MKNKFERGYRYRRTSEMDKPPAGSIVICHMRDGSDSDIRSMESCVWSWLDIPSDVMEFTIVEMPDQPSAVEYLHKGAQHVEDQPSAVDYLRKGAQHIEDRASQRDCPDGERSMAKTVEAFNTIYGHNLSETDGWQFMSILKKVRAVQGGYHEDDYEDDIGYAALAAECAALRQREGVE